MSKIQLERLKNDLIELETYIAQVRKQGRKDLVSKLNHKRDYLSSKIAVAA